MIRRLTALLILVAVLACAGAAFAGPIQVTVDGRSIAFDQPPMMMNGRVLVPVRGVFESLGASVRYDPGTRQITATRGATTVILRIGSQIALVDSQQRTLDVPAQVYGIRTLVPLRFVSEALGAEVHWNEAQQLISITSQGGVSAAPPSSQPPPMAAGPLISSVSPDTTGPLSAGQTLTVTMYGQPGGQALLDVGGQTALPMYEGPSGVYKGTYTVRNRDNNPSSAITCHLTLNGQSDVRSAPSTVALVGRGGSNLGAGGYQMTGYQTHLIDNLQVLNRSGGLIDVSFTGPSGGTAFFDLNGRRVQMYESPAGNYRGTYQLQPGESMSNAPMTGYLQLANSYDISRSPVLVTASSGGIGGGLSQALPAINNVSTSGSGPFYGGQTLSVTAQGTPGMRATFTLMSHTVPMLESSPGVYSGSYVIRSGDMSFGAPVTVTLTNGSGQTASLSASGSVSLIGNVNIAGQTPTTTTLPAGRSIVLDQPSMGSLVGSSFNVSGRAAAGSVVRLEIYQTDQPTPGGRLLQRALTTQTSAGADGRFFFPVTIQGGTAGINLSVMVHDLDNSGNEIGNDQTVITMH